MSEEEKEAIEDFKREYNDGRILKSDIIIELDTARIVIALIDKLQKENQELKEENTELENELSKLQCDYRQLHKGDEQLYNKINKFIGEIKEAIKEGDSEATGYGLEGGSGIVIGYVNKVLEKYNIDKI